MGTLIVAGVATATISRLTITSWVAVAVLSFASVTVQVTVVVPVGNTAGASFVIVTSEQLSAVTGVPSTTLDAVFLPASTSTVTSAGAVIVGLMLSCTVTMAIAVCVLQLLSVTVSVTSTSLPALLQSKLYLLSFI